ncbi:aminotransferase class IV [Prauserella cavernicola]|uniref:Aminotransferase class IV n=1 Tax=Prauserella cavernicola TaxID=2800127 RepID=A0A934V711_9PSEU|nr:aminotransferase class IV [Prauserella cavernicola]MBK1788097.1 aminotransferase class IV [Prauserella cavernicola]
MLRTYVNGEPGTAEQLAVPAVVNYGHFTSLQVRDGHTRDLDAHLRRLAEGTRELFGSDLDTGLVREYLRQAVTGAGDVTARITLFSLSAPSGADSPVPPDVLVTLRPPSSALDTPVRLRSVRYERVLPEVKHVGTFGLLHHLRAAKRAGYDDALFVTAEGIVSEASVWNAGFFDGETVVWPQAPQLSGTMRLLLDRGLAELGVPTVTRPLSLAEATAQRSAFLCNSGNPGLPVASVDDVELTVDAELTTLLRRACERTPLERI